MTFGFWAAKNIARIITNSVHSSASLNCQIKKMNSGSQLSERPNHNKSRREILSGASDIAESFVMSQPR